MSMLFLTPKQISDHEALFYTGCAVKLGTHDEAVLGKPDSANWNHSMKKYVGAQTKITSINGNDRWGWMIASVDIDKGAHSWRCINMDNITAGVAAPIGKGPSSGPKLVVATPMSRAGVGDPWGSGPLPLPDHKKELEAAPKDRMDRTLGDYLAEHQLKKIRELNKMAEERAKYKPY